MKLIDLLNLEPLIVRIKDKKMPFKTTYKFSKILKALTEESLFYSKELQKLIEEYSEKDNNGNPVRTEEQDGIKIQKDKIEEFSKKLTELQNLEIIAPDIIFDINELETLEFSISDLLVLNEFIQN